MSSENQPNKLDDVELKGKENGLSVTRARQLCAEHLECHWSTADDNDIEVTILTGGFLNRVYLCTNKKTSESVIIRLFGGGEVEIPKDEDKKDGESFFSRDRAAESLTFYVCGQHGIAPKLLGIFDGGRIEEYINNADTLSNEDISNPDIMAAYAKKLAAMHSLDIPVSKKPRESISNITTVREVFQNNWKDYVEYAREVSNESGMTDGMIKAINDGLNVDWIGMLDWFEATWAKLKHRIVYCHNDTNRANCMVRGGKSLPADKRVVLLDYEFASYRPRGCDIGQHFGNRYFDVTDFLNTPVEEIVSMTNKYPSLEERRHFISVYLEEYRVKCPDIFDESIDNVDNVLLEAEFFPILRLLIVISMVVKQKKDVKAPSPVKIPAPIMLGLTARVALERKKIFLQLS